MKQKRNTKRLISLLLCLCLAVLPLCAALSAAAAGNENDLSKYPSIRVLGAEWELYNRYGTPEQEQVYPVNEPDGYILEKAKELLPILAKSIITDDYDEYIDGLLDAVVPLYEKFIPDENGDPQNGPSIPPAPPLTDKRQEDGTYEPGCYSFEVDWRLGPIEQGRLLAELIDDVLEVTGAEKVTIYSRCESAGEVLVYLTDYGPDKVAAVLFESSLLLGSVQASNAFSGDLVIDSDMVNRFCARELGNPEDGGVYNDLLSDSYTAQLLRDTVSLLCTNGTVDVLGKLIMHVYGKIKDRVVPELLMNSYGRLLSYWALVDNEHYEKAREFMLSDPKWANFRARTDDYHYNYQLNMRDTLLGCADEGVKFLVIAKYGLEMVPILAESKELNDNSVATRDGTLGATCAKVDTFLSDEYLAEADRNGTAKYISADRKIDASTCFFPDSTWVIKNCPHGGGTWEEIVSELIDRFLTSGGEFNVFTDPERPQFLLMDQETCTVTPLTEENAFDTETVYPDNFFSALAAFLRSFFRFIGHIFRDKVFVKA